jgi:hypothetical protein
VSDDLEPGVPFRWDLFTPDHLGSMIDDSVTPDLWFLPELVACAGKVLARSGGGDLVFVGRSLDSMFDLLGGALSGIDDAPRLSRLPFSFYRPFVLAGRRWRRRSLTPSEVQQARRILSSVGADPDALASRARPLTFVDVVNVGGTFTELFALLSDWLDERPGAWNAARLKLRFVGVTTQEKTSPKTFRWQQHEDWPQRLPARSVMNVSLDPSVWSHLGNHQIKLTRSFRPDRWLAEDPGPDRDQRTREALAEAVAIVEYGRSPEGRRAITAAISGEPALREPWLRSLVSHLNGRR